MRAILLFLLAAVTALAADDPWAKVKALKSGAEIRVYKRGDAQPLTAQMGELTDENLVVIVKKSQTPILREEIDRIDARPQGGSRVTTKSTTKESMPGTKEAPLPMTGADRPTTTTSSNVVVGGKPGFETVYRRPAEGKKK